jgi:NAD(P)-dependent dehydrogenase (short-subunit alcohol dehydrogenase family)
VKIQGTAALVTGGASGLGLATVERLATAGAHVTIVDLPTSQGKEIAEKLGDSVSFAPADVTDETAIAGALAGIAASDQDLRIVVNCAGSAPRRRS